MGDSGLKKTEFSTGVTGSIRKDDQTAEFPQSLASSPTITLLNIRSYD